MKRKLILIIFTLFSIYAFAQDSTKFKVNTAFTLSTKNFWRGAVYGNNVPSVSGNLSLIRKNFELGATGTSPLNGTSVGYGIWMELFTTYTFKQFSITVDDYFFFNENDKDNDYFNYNQKSTQHLIEYRIKYSVDKFNLMAGWLIYHSQNANNAGYFEGEYFLLPELSILAGYVTGRSSLNFYDKGGITHVGVAGAHKLEITDKFSIPVKAALLISPNYKNISDIPGLRKNPINLVLTFSF